MSWWVKEEDAHVIGDIVGHPVDIATAPIYAISSIFVETRVTIVF